MEKEAAIIGFIDRSKLTKRIAFFSHLLNLILYTDISMINIVTMERK